MSDCYWEDEGGILAEMDYEARLCEEDYLECLRETRLLNQRGKFLIKATKNGKELYLQDQRISNKGYWTQFKSNARVFRSEAEAKKVLKHFKYNNPRVVRG